MPDDDDAYALRLGFWLRMARERAGKSQAGAATAIGLSPKSKSSVSDWENGRVPALSVLRRLAAYYEVPLEVFTHPDPTPDERLDELVRLAGARERADWEAGEGRDPETGDGPADAPRRRSA